MALAIVMTTTTAMAMAGTGLAPQASPLRQEARIDIRFFFNCGEEKIHRMDKILHVGTRSLCVFLAPSALFRSRCKLVVL